MANLHRFLFIFVSIVIFSPNALATCNAPNGCLYPSLLCQSLCILSNPPSCHLSSVEETNPSISCNTLKTASTGVDVDPDLYGGGFNHHTVPMAHHYYYSRLNEAFGSCCPTDTDEIALMELTTPWSGYPTGIAWEIGYRCRAFRRDCTFPTATTPFICTGADGTIGVHGTTIGTLYNYPLLTNDATQGNGVWTLFGQCWNGQTPENPNGSNSPVSWNVFSLTKALSEADKTAIKAKVSSLGFQDTNPFLLEQIYP